MSENEILEMFAEQEARQLKAEKKAMKLKASVTRLYTTLKKQNIKVPNLKELEKEVPANSEEE